MSLVVQDLIKIYGQQKAVNHISFSVSPGEIVGFLGPNGAGKSTTMKIATGYVSPTAGEVTVGGHKVSENPMAVKQITGYLPEHNPLYLDLYVHEYLSFVGKLYGIGGSTLKKRVAEMVDICGLTREQNKKIETLSKGYRQRVGLAQALIHDPQVLILDEPTSGLDPNQLVEIRNLIKTISANKTVIFSTHIMQEVQALCDRVVVINKGQIVADSSLAAMLSASADTVVLVAEFGSETSVEVFDGLTGVKNVEKISPTTFKISVSQGADLRAEIFRLAADKNLSLVGLRIEEQSLEHVFRSLTQTEGVEH
ncbi:gliding motility-associated ABC transporter ATP-binding subunit GldA [Pseudochryseolinea flava]|uniref:Gliding motility-associated ABC transporter ATP-binding subunit GldA n=1 Tax=Pseudochryseolinea flava TaxID=2059302 RepID=A0A364Y743_9BACT|nr:gliding motility-associated ABC transporter ATP-binding subunit GldA [Pseudochryseolinea flava]RAW01908.1 gliding motility-associated ABC transporter ATP-binding subunit GldA [Pseudochryseolinea flava]